MSASFVLTLDTTAPDVVFGGAGGTTAGELLQLEYVSSEPLEHAELRLRDGRTLAMSVGDGVLEVLLPADTPEGPVTLAAFDDVGNEAVYPALLVLAGVPYVPPEPSPGPPPPRGGGGFRHDERRDRRILRTRSVCNATAVTSVSRRDATTSRARVRSRSRAGVALGDRRRLLASSRSALRTRHSAGAPASPSTRTSVTRRRGDPPPETLIALDLL